MEHNAPKGVSMIIEIKKILIYHVYPFTLIDDGMNS